MLCSALIENKKCRINMPIQILKILSDTFYKFAIINKIKYVSL